jgi:hypothetical protein
MQWVKTINSSEDYYSKIEESVIACSKSVNLESIIKGITYQTKLLSKKENKLNSHDIYNTSNRTNSIPSTPQKIITIVGDRGTGKTESLKRIIRNTNKEKIKNMLFLTPWPREKRAWNKLIAECGINGEAYTYDGLSRTIIEDLWVEKKKGNIHWVTKSSDDIVQNSHTERGLIQKLIERSEISPEAAHWIMKTEAEKIKLLMPTPFLLVIDNLDEMEPEVRFWVEVLKRKAKIIIQTYKSYPPHDDKNSSTKQDEIITLSPIDKDHQFYAVKVNINNPSQTNKADGVGNWVKSVLNSNLTGYDSTTSSKSGNITKTMTTSTTSGIHCVIIQSEKRQWKEYLNKRCKVPLRICHACELEGFHYKKIIIPDLSRGWGGMNQGKAWLALICSKTDRGSAIARINLHNQPSWLPKIPKELEGEAELFLTWGVH